MQRKTRRYPDLDDNDEVKIYKKKERFEKERKSVWSDNSYTIEKYRYRITKNTTS
jgi:hypothetical protein